MHKDEAFIGGVRGMLWLDTDVEEADASFELLPHRPDLAADGGKGTVVGWRVVGSGNGKCGKGV